MARPDVRVVVMLETADESSIPLEVAARVDDAEGIEQTVCSVREPAPDTFGVDVEWLGGSHRLDPSAYRHLWGLVRGADVLHVHPNATGAIARLLSVPAGVGVASTEHNSHAHAGRAKNLVRGVTNPLGDAVVAVSSAVADSFARWETALLGLAGVETRVIHNGVDVEGVRAAADRDPGVDLPDGFLVGTGGRLVAQKNLATLVEAVASLAGDCPDLGLVVTGDGPRRGPLEALARRRGVADRVQFTGYLPERADVHALYSRLDAYALPSRHEGWGVAVGEAMAAGLPVVVSDIPPFREVVGDAGLYGDPDDPAAFAAHLRDLRDDHDRRRALGEAGRRRVDDRFPIERTADEHVALYRSLAGGR